MTRRYCGTATIYLRYDRVDDCYRGTVAVAGHSAGAAVRARSVLGPGALSRCAPWAYDLAAAALIHNAVSELTWDPRAVDFITPSTDGSAILRKRSRP
jgi:cyanophycinase-like exopeptidase